MNYEDLKNPELQEKLIESLFNILDKKYNRS